MANLALHITGMRFGRLTVIKRVGYEGGKSTWLCKCECGGTRVTKGVYLTRGATTSCGCVRGGNHRTHGKSQSPEYLTWAAMKTRCTNPAHHLYHRYGGRGLRICKRWFAFENFYADMGPRPNGYSIERIDNDKGYSPSNCRWATPKEQARNTIKNRFFTWKGRRYCLKELAEMSGIKRTTLGRRLDAGWSLQNAMSTAVIQKGGRS